MSEAAPRRGAEALGRWPWVVVFSTVAGALYGARFGSAPSGAATGALTGGCLAGLEIYVLNGSRVLRLPFAVYFLLRVLVYVAAIAAADIAVSSLFGRLSSLADFMRGDLAFALGMSVAVNLLFGVNELLGPGVLFAFAAGRYRKPRRENRVLLYLDLCGSTALAERLGEERFLDLLNAFFGDVTQEIAREGGDIHKYVGDEVIAVWRDGTPAARPIRACFAARRALRQRAAVYRAEFGEVPEFRAAIHAGAVVVGELGARKKEIALIGDAMNTAARILEAARENGASVLISSRYFERASAPVAGIAARRLAPVALRGKAAPLDLAALDDGLFPAEAPL